MTQGFYLHEKHAINKQQKGLLEIEFDVAAKSVFCRVPIPLRILKQPDKLEEAGSPDRYLKVLQKRYVNQVIILPGKEEVD